MREHRRSDPATDAGSGPRRRRFRGPRTGSISVADLLGGQPFSGRSGPTATSETGLPDGDAPHEPQRHTEDSPPIHRGLRRTIGVAAIVLLLAAGTTISAMLARSTGTDDAHPRVPSAISGSRALRVDLLTRQAGWDPPKLTAEEPERHPTDLSLSDLLREDRASLLRANPSAGSSESSVRLVSEFYELLGEEPRAAVLLLHPRVSGTAESEIVAGWRALRTVTARDVVATDGAVLGTVSARDSAGKRLVLRHSFSVTEGSEPRIARVELRAARFDSARQ